MTTEWLLPAAFAAGFFGSGHCFGMCGAIVALLERPVGARGRLPHRLVYNLGRLLFYVLLGVIAAALGVVLTQLPIVDTVLLLLRLLAGLIVVLLGLNLLLDVNGLAFLERGGATLWRRIAPLAQRVLPADTLPRALAAGFIWGALPCGLVYSAVAMAATTASLPVGALVMLAFWTGTLPALLAAGSFAGRLGFFSRDRRLRRVCGALLLAAGLAALLLPFLHGQDDTHSGHGMARSDAQSSVALLFETR